MPDMLFETNGELKMVASKNSSKNDFDFLLGYHKVHHKKLKTRLNNCTEWVEFEGTHKMEKHLAGIANVENHYMPDENGQSIEGMAVRLYNSATRLWSIYWADSKNGVLDNPVMGSFEDNIGYFLGKDNFEGKPIILKFKWDVTNPEMPEWSQAFSNDNGKTWEWNWYMVFSKAMQV